VTAVVVFDGAPPDAPSDAVSIVVGVDNESADDWIAREAARLRAAETSYWLVTSDRELRARAGEGAERVIGGGSFARMLVEEG
jgi:predicted RNA-binding protein with PIN domain